MHQSKVPQLRFPEFENNWDSKVLGSCFSRISSGKNKSSAKGKFDVYGSTGKLGKSDDYGIDGETILIARVGANAGKINLVNGKFGVTDNTIIMNENDKDLMVFLFYSLSHFNLGKLIYGTGQPLITAGQLKKIDLSIPTIEEQEKIASFLSSVDSKIEKLTRKKELLEEYKKGVMQKLFSQEIRFKDDNGNDYPDWEKENLINVCSIEK